MHHEMGRHDSICQPGYKRDAIQVCSALYLGALSSLICRPLLFCLSLVKIMFPVHLLPIGLLAMLPLALAAPYCALTPPNTSRATSSVQGKAAASSEDVLATAWYPGWLGNKFPPSKISWKKYTAMTFAFACVYSCLYSSTRLK